MEKKVDLVAFAEELVDWWRASDGGLTMAACDVLHVAAWAQGLLEAVADGRVSRSEAIEQLNDALWRASTGSEGDVIAAALEAI